MTESDVIAESDINDESDSLDEKTLARPCLLAIKSESDIPDIPDI